MPNDSTHPSQPGLTTSETIETLLQRRSIRKYSDAPVTDAQVDAILQAAFRAPTSSNIQSYTVITVRDPETKQKLAVPAGNQKHIADCPVFLAFCADLTRLEHVLQERGHTLEDNNLEIGLPLDRCVTCRHVGLSHGRFARHQRCDDWRGPKRCRKIAEILELPKFVYCVFGMCLGYPAEMPQQSRVWTKFSLSIGRNSAGETPSVEAYDPALRSHYESIGKATTPDSWSHDMDKKFHPQLRDGLREQLKKQGFDFR